LHESRLETFGSYDYVEPSGNQRVELAADEHEFKVTAPMLLDGLKVGQKVTFELKSEGTKEIVTAIALAK
jgi:hypothetical protein